MGIQAQFFSYANYAAKIRGIDLEKKDTLFKAWTLRGTMHVHNIKDHNIFIHKELLSKYIKGFWEDGDIVPGDRKNFFCREVVDCIKNGIKKKSDIIAHCYEVGMNEYEKQELFNSWGGIPRYLVESGEIVLECMGETEYRIVPDIMRISLAEAELEQLRRYIKTYGPVTVYDMMYFFRWNKSKILNLLSDIDYCKMKVLGELFYYMDNSYSKLKSDSDMFVLSGFDPFIIGYEKRNSIIINEQNIRDIYLLQGVIRPTLFWNKRVVGVWWKAQKSITVKFFENIPEEIKKGFYRLLDRLLGDDAVKYIEIEASK